jgi:hypothetical protein
MRQPSVFHELVWRCSSFTLLYYEMTGANIPSSFWNQPFSASPLIHGAQQEHLPGMFAHRCFHRSLCTPNKIRWENFQPPEERKHSTGLNDERMVTGLAGGSKAT